MDEDRKIELNTAELEAKRAAEMQLNSYINPIKIPNSGDTNVSETSSIPRPEPLIKISDIPAQTEPEKQTRPIIRTYKSDVEGTIQTGHLSSINIAMAENRKMLGQARFADIEVKKSKLNKIILIVSLVLVFGGLLIFFIPQLLIQLKYGEKAAPVETVSSEPIITVDLQDKINLKDINLNRISTTLKDRVDESATKLGQIKNIYLTEGEGVNEKLITASKFLQLIGASVPASIQRTLKAPYMFGLYNYNGNQRFVVLKVGSYDTTFSGMFTWETTLWQDFKELFGLQTDNSSSGNTFSIEIKKFQDATFNNKDCRVVKDQSGNIIFLYSIIDQNTIVITTSTDTLREIMNRISKSRTITQ